MKIELSEKDKKIICYIKAILILNIIGAMEFFTIMYFASLTNNTLIGILLISFIIIFHILIGKIVFKHYNIKN